jgi:hypothetical protein
VAPPEIAETLRLFDRKERHLVIQSCLGKAASTLSEDFRNQLASTLRSRLPAGVQPGAWWATDYHLEWLAGALVWHAEHGRGDRERVRENENELIRGNQEDIDLIVASGSDVILVEAKGHFSFGSAPLKSKIQRLTTLCDSSTGIVAGSDAVRLHFVLTSINKPVKLNYAGWPAWTKNGDSPYWMPLLAHGDRMRVGRCDNEGHSDAEGGYWHIWRESKLPPS